MTIRDIIYDKIWVIDGAMGTALQERDLTAADFGGTEFEGCNEHLVLTCPDIIQSVHETYLEAGADIVETNTFGGTRFVLDEYGLGYKMEEINRQAVALARAACDRYQTTEKPYFVAGSMGPTTKSLSVTGGITFDEMAEAFEEQALYLIDAGVDYLLLETALDTLNLKAGYIGILKASERLKKTCPVAVSGTIETMGTMLAGQGVEALYTSVEHMNLLYIGLNCATGPEFMRGHIRALSEHSKVPVFVVPNAGIPDADGVYPETPDMMSRILEDFMKEGWLNGVGGCCGTTASHIKALANKAAQYSARRPKYSQKTRISGIDYAEIDPKDGCAIVGERANVIGSRKFKRLIEAENYDEACEVARKQVKAGAHIVDVCLSNPDRDEIADMKRFLGQLTKMVKAPLMIDSQVPEVVEESFKLIQGKSILNSINLEDGEKAFEELLPIVKRYGAAVVVGCIRGEMAVTAEEKLDVARESYELMTKKYGIPEEDIIFDPLVFPCGTGDENYFGSGRQTIEGVRLIREHYPNCRMTLGISNVSFGLPGAGREILNSVFLHHCIKAGLDTAIVNSEKIVRYSTITEEERHLCDDLLDYNTENGNEPVANFAAYFRDKKVETKIIDRSNLSIEEKLEENIVQGTKEYLIENLDEALKEQPPLAVINTHLMRAMNIVGKLFNDNELIVAEVLQSAEVMKAAVTHLEQFMEEKESNIRGKILLATVKGDVHDIGKNLVEIILSNNGYQVVDLGIKCLPEVIIQACREHNPDIIGLSGLLVKSAQQMVTTAGDLKKAGIEIPIMVGGAALTDRFTSIKIADAYNGIAIYCKDAMTGLRVANELTNPETVTEWIHQLKTHQREIRNKTAATQTAPKKRPAQKTVHLTYDHETRPAPHFRPTVINPGLDVIWPYINQQMVYGAHLGLKGNVPKMLSEGNKKAIKLSKHIDTMKAHMIANDLATAKGVYQFFKARSEGNDVVILDPETEQEIQRFQFPRQDGGNELCLTDYMKPNQVEPICFFVVTSGQKASQYCNQLKEEGKYGDSAVASAIALECAEGCAEYIHQQIRTAWGMPDKPGITTAELYKLHYTGLRVSFGYPACPRLEDQAKLWKILDPEKHIGVTLSEEYMMWPEGSVSGMVFYHPQARYFRINETELATFEAKIKHSD